MTALETFLQKAKEISEWAHPKPWDTSRDNNGTHVIQTKHTTRDVWYIPRGPSDSEFIAFSRNNFDTLIRIVEKQQEALEYIESIRDKDCQRNACSCAYDTACEAIKEIEELCQK